MTDWTSARWACFDTETTGVNVKTDRIVEAAIVLVGGGLPTEVRIWLIDPGIEIPAAATAVHKITTEHVREHGEQPGPAIYDISVQLRWAMDSGIPIVGWNCPYDLSILDAEAVRHSEGFSPFAPGAIRPVIDGLVLDKACDTYRKGSRRLADVARHYGVTLAESDAHGAEADALAAARTVWQIARRYPQLTEMTLDQLHDRQVEWATEQQESFEKYKRRTDPSFTVERGWPVYIGSGS